MATHSNILAWKSPWTEEPGGLQSMGLHDWACMQEGGGRWVGSNKLVELKKKKNVECPWNMGSTSSDSTNSGSKILGEKSPERSKIQNLNLPHAGNYLHNFDMVLGIVSNLERIKSIQEDAHKLYANTMPFDIRHLSSCSFAIWGASEISLPWILKDDYIWIKNVKAY